MPDGKTVDNVSVNGSGLSIQEIAILHITYDFQRDMPDRPYTLPDDYRELLFLSDEEHERATSRLRSDGFMAKSKGAFFLTPKGLKLFKRRKLGPHTFKQVRAFIDHRMASPEDEFNRLMSSKEPRDG